MNISPERKRELHLREFVPRSQLVVQQILVSKPKTKVIDAHNHVGEEFGGGWCKRPVEDLLDVLEEPSVDVSEKCSE